MARIFQTAVLAAICAAASAPAFAAQCNIVGTFKDSLGTTGKFVSETKGTATNSAVCAQSYNLTVTKLTTVILDVKGKPKSGSCGVLHGTFKFQGGGCTTAKGTITIAGLGTFADTVTHTGKIAQSKSPDLSDFTSGLK